MTPDPRIERMSAAEYYANEPSDAEMKLHRVELELFDLAAELGRAEYRCPTCGATKTIKDRYADGALVSPFVPPTDLPCGWRGCGDRAVRVPSKVWVPPDSWRRLGAEQ